MLFKLRLVEEHKDDTLIGWEWLEVLSIQPFTFAKAMFDGDVKGSRAYRFTLQFICRSPTGIVSLTEGDLWPEMDAGIYVEVRDGE